MEHVTERLNKMTQLEEASSLSGNFPSGAFRNLGTYQWVDGDRLQDAADEGLYYPIAFVVWREAAQHIREALR
jgi:hypothetical protein